MPTSFLRLFFKLSVAVGIAVLLGAANTPVFAQTAAPANPYDNGYSELADELSPPQLEVQIPGVSFSDVDKTLDEQGNISTPFIGEYLSAVYKFAMIVASVVAVIMIIMEGVKIILSGGGEQKVASYQHIFRIVTGICLVWGSYFILYTINPDLVNFKILKVKFVEPQELIEDNHPDENELAKDTTPTPEGGTVKKGPCTSNKEEALANRGAVSNLLDFSFFGKIDGNTTGVRPASAIKRIVIHNGGYSASMNNSTWVKGKPGSPAVGAHYTIDRSGKVFQHVSETCRISHAPSANSDGIGIELNIDKDSSGNSCNSLKKPTAADVLKACSPTSEQYASLNKLIDDITARYKIVKNEATIVGHCEVVKPSGHGDPRAFDWSRIGLSNEIKKERGKKGACSWYLPF